MERKKIIIVIGVVLIIIVTLMVLSSRKKNSKNDLAQNDAKVLNVTYNINDSGNYEIYDSDGNYITTVAHEEDIEYYEYHILDKPPASDPLADDEMIDLVEND